MTKKLSNKAKRKKIHSLLCLLIFLILGLYCFIAFLGDNATLKKWDTGGIKEYYGAYTLARITYPRNVVYRFSLQNGDLVEVASEYLSDKNQLANSTDTTKLLFKYSAFPKPFSRAHEAVSIVSEDTDTIYVDESVIRKNIENTSGLYLFLGLCAFAPALGWIFLFAFPKISRHIYSLKKCIDK